MLQSLNDIKSNSIDICFRVVNVLLQLLNDIINHPNQPKFRRLYLEGDVIQNNLLPFAGAMEFLFEIGFIDDGISLVLPECISLSTLNNCKQQLTNIISEHKKLNLNENSFLKEISSTSLAVLKFEDKILQSKALDNLSPEDIELFSNFNKNEPLYHEKLMLKLMTWFKESFFKWFDTPICQFCSSTTKFKGINQDKIDENVKYSEMYECNNCCTITEFKRYGICEQLLTTRQGRCGEWANCFTLFCRALGWEARLAVDKTDHVWTEVWSVHQKRWIHCDPCETALDKPLLYEKGWGKKLSYVIAYSNEEVQDVTWRYVENSYDVLKRRTLCSENDLLNTILNLSQHRQNNLSLSRCKYIAARRLKECFEMLFEPTCTVGENYGGRTSGALAWRLARGEMQIEKFVWTPSETEIANKRFELKYSTAFDKYIHGNSTHKGWKSGVYSYTSLFRKEELDWKNVYLCREERCEKSTIEWRFDFSSSGLVIQDIKLIYTTALFNTGQVEWKLIGNNLTVNLPTIENIKEVIVDQMEGADFVTLNATLSGGSGDTAWQHSQIFRQSIKDQDYPFQIVFNLK
ncbi:peptide-N(4)-(N-acetyl-beta-glucosaminyl)asparagine amidase [Metopolophium dirhodum]|uniref:peptide-N(4)-(N-acetyl-beta- glucosaminyl)asparagine amidase n=1 Tax=Metopolophium dirhodum TaxID=44670 RepID=UPI00298F5CA0|nr:peptide-N(4)-(N-acetyl-beta-glucosaminyl)asparagine amidase [Metopolophium dirhodum]